MSRQLRPRCYGCDNKARARSRFCSMRCAAAYAEELIEGNEDAYCPTCNSWEGLAPYEEAAEGSVTLSCGHSILEEDAQWPPSNTASPPQSTNNAAN